MPRHTINADTNFEPLLNGQLLGIRSREVELSSLNGATAVAAAIIPSGGVVVGVTTQVTVPITGATSYDVGDGVDIDIFGAGATPAINTITDNSSWTVNNIPMYANGSDIVLTANGGNFTAGTVRVTVHYLTIDANKNLDPLALGIAALPESLTINSQTVFPTYWYEGRDATLAAWTARHGSGGTLTAEGSGGTTNIVPPTLGTTDRAVDTDTTRRWQGVANLDRTTKDFVLEFVGAFSGEAGYAMAVSTRPDEGIALLKDTGATRFSFWANGDALAVVNGATGLVAGNYYHVMVFYDASGSAQIFVDGVASGSAVVVSSVGSIDDAEDLQIGAYGNDTLPWNEEIAFFALWESPNWLDTHSQAAIAAARAAIVGISN